MVYCLAGACSRYNARSDWLSAMAFLSRNGHGLITNYAKRKKKVIQRPNCFYFLKIVGAKTISDDEHS